MEKEFKLENEIVLKDHKEEFGCSKCIYVKDQFCLREGGCGEIEMNEYYLDGNQTSNSQSTN